MSSGGSRNQIGSMEIANFVGGRIPVLVKLNHESLKREIQIQVGHSGNSCRQEGLVDPRAAS